MIKSFYFTNKRNSDLTLQTRVELGVMAVNRCFTFPKLEDWSLTIIWFSVISNTIVEEIQCAKWDVFQTKSYKVSCSKPHNINSLRMIGKFLDFFYNTANTYNYVHTHIHTYLSVCKLVCVCVCIISYKRFFGMCI